MADTFTLTLESDPVNVSDSAALTEARALQLSSAIADSGTLTEARAAAITGSVVDAGALSDSAAMASQDAKAGSDSAILSEVTDKTESGEFGVSDNFTLTESSTAVDYASTVFADMPTAYYRFTETSGSSYEDATGNGHTGTTAAPPTLAQPGITGSSDELAFHFDPATSQRIGLPSTDFVGFSDRTWTMECWARPDTDAPANGVFIGAGRTTGTAPTLLLGHGSPASQLRIVVRNDAGTSVDMTTSGLNLVDGQWHHVVMTQNGTAVRAYVDGVQVLTSSSGPGTPYTITRTTLAALQRNTLTGLYKGILDEVALYNYPLTLTQVQEHYAAGLADPTNTFVRAAAAAADTATITEDDVLGETLLQEGADSGTLGEQSNTAQSSFLEGTDSAALTEAVAQELRYAVADTAALIEAAAANIAAAASDSATLSEQTVAGATDFKAASDSGTLSEARALATQDMKAATDAASLSEARTIAITGTVTDSGLVSEARDVSGTVSAVDAATLAEAAAAVRTDAKSASDAATLAEAVIAARTDQIVASDSATLSEARALSAALAVIDTSALGEAVLAAQIVMKAAVDAGVLTEEDEAAIFIGADYTHSLPPQIIVGGYQGEGIVNVVSADGASAPYAAILVGAYSARGVLLTDYEGDGTLR